MTDSKRELGQALDQYRVAAKVVLDRRGGDKTAADWALYTAAAASAMSLVGNAEAAIVYSGLQNITVTRPAAGDYSYRRVDLDFNGYSDVELGIDNGYYYPGIVAAYVGAPAPYAFIGAGAFAARLSSGATISSGKSFSPSQYPALRLASDGGGSIGNWGYPNDTGFAGVRFERGEDTHYAWLRLKLTSDPTVPSELTLVDWAWEDQPDTDIAAGVVPLPGSLGFLAAGAAGLALFRRRRKTD